MKYFLLPLLFFLTACSFLGARGKPTDGKRIYTLIDGSGRYVYSRETRLTKGRLITRTQIVTHQGSEHQQLEKSVMVSQLGSVKSRQGRALSIRPFGSEFTVWLEGKKYESRTRLDVGTKSLQLELKSPESKWQGRSSFAFPKGNLFCYFSQLPDCLYHANLLPRAIESKGKGLSFYIVWDAYPYLQEQLSGVGSRLFSLAEVKYEKTSKNLFRYLVEVDGQSLLYEFSKSFDLVRMFWVAQGISIIPQGEEMPDLEE